MHDRALRARDRLERSLDELGAGLREDGDGRVVRNELLLDQEPCEVEVRLRRRREADLDLANAERDQEIEEPALARGVHRVDERLVAVTQVGGAPDRRAVDDAVRPRAIGEIDGRVRSVLPVRHGHRAALLLGSGDGATAHHGCGTARVCRRVASPSGEGWRAGGPAGEVVNERGGRAGHARTIPESHAGLCASAVPRMRIRAGARTAKTLAAQKGHVQVSDTVSDTKACPLRPGRSAVDDARRRT